MLNNIELHNMIACLFEKQNPNWQGPLSERAAERTVADLSSKRHALKKLKTSTPINDENDLAYLVTSLPPVVPFFPLQSMT